MSYPIRFAEQLRQHLKSLRRARGLTQTALGKQLGVSQARIAELEANPGLVSMEQMLQVFSALGVSMSLNEDPAQRTLKTHAITEPNLNNISRTVIWNGKAAAEPTTTRYYSSGNAIDLHTFKFEIPPESEMKRLNFGFPRVGVNPKIISAVTREDKVRLDKNRLTRPPSGKISTNDLKGVQITNINRTKKGSW